MISLAIHAEVMLILSLFYVRLKSKRWMVKRSG